MDIYEKLWEDFQGVNRVEGTNAIYVIFLPCDNGELQVGILNL